MSDLATSADPGPAIEQKGGLLYNAACAYGLCATLSLKDKPQPTDSESAEPQKYLDLSLACLKEALAAGWQADSVWRCHRLRSDDRPAAVRWSAAFSEID